MTVVFKLGGSLLTLKHLIPKLQEVVRQRSQHNCLLIAGGGATADIVRRWSEIFPLNDEAIHWLAIASLDFNRQLLQELMKWDSVQNRLDAEQKWNRATAPLLLEMSRFLKDEEGQAGKQFPHDWSVTTDSLAAWTALRWPAEELILLKSIPTPHGLTAQEASDREFVDPFFPKLAVRMTPIRWCNLRASEIQIEPWL